MLKVTTYMAVVDDDEAVVEVTRTETVELGTEDQLAQAGKVLVKLGEQTLTEAGSQLVAWRNAMAEQEEVES